MEFDAFVTILKNDVGIMKENITMQDRLVEDLCMNSLSYMILISSIERKLEINFPIEQIKKMDTVGVFYSFIQAFKK